MLDSTRVSPVTLSFSTVISTEYMASTRGTGYAAAATQVPPSGLQPSQGEEPGAEPSSGDVPGASLPSSTSFHGPPVPWQQVWTPLLHPRPFLAFPTRSGKPRTVPFAQRS